MLAGDVDHIFGRKSNGNGKFEIKWKFVQNNIEKIPLFNVIIRKVQVCQTYWYQIARPTIPTMSNVKHLGITVELITNGTEI